MTKYSFFSGCGAAWLEDFETSVPAVYASELAAFRGIDPDEVTWEPAAGTVDGLDKFFPSEMTSGERATLGHIDALKAEIQQANISLDAADIPAGKLHERVASALESLRHWQWQAGHYKVLYDARLKRLEEMEATK